MRQITFACQPSFEKYSRPRWDETAGLAQQLLIRHETNA